jgi:hypothetical protein
MEWDGDKMKTFLGDQMLLSSWSSGDPDICSAISRRSGNRQSVGKKKPVDVDDEENPGEWIMGQLDEPSAPPMGNKNTPSLG